jgi:hypothetical protein
MKRRRPRGRSAGRRAADRDLLRLGFLALRQPDRQHAVLVARADPRGIDRGRQRERARERTVVPLHPLVAVLARLVVDLPLAREREDVVLEGDVDVLALHVRQLRLQHDFVFGRLVNIDRRSPRAAEGPAVEIVEHAIEPVDLHPGQLTSRIPPNQSHCFQPPRAWGRTIMATRNS